MNHRDHVGLIRQGVEGAGRDWLELGSGDGAFTMALADVLGPGGRIAALDRDPGPLAIAVQRTTSGYGGVAVSGHVADFVETMPEGTFDGILAANSFHFIRDRKPVLAAIRRALRPGGRLVIVEYDADNGNHWVPFPFSFERWRQEAAVAGLTDVALLRRVPSRFLGGIYGAVAVSPAAPPNPSGTAGRP